MTRQTTIPVTGKPKRGWSVRSILQAVCLLATTALVSACGSSDPALSIADLPVYPNATERESMSGQDPMFGSLKAELGQFSTTDDHDDVVEFYRSRLSEHSPDISSHALADGRQTSISIADGNVGITIAVQEYPADGQVMITFMRVGP